MQGDASALGHPLYFQSSTCMLDAGHFDFPPMVHDAAFAVAAILCSPQGLMRVKDGLPGA